MPAGSRSRADADAEVWKLTSSMAVTQTERTVERPAGAEALSGLAYAFFYAGARALLVSHWSVDSKAAARLTTSTFAIMTADPKLGQAEAPYPTCTQEVVGCRHYGSLRGSLKSDDKDHDDGKQSRSPATTFFCRHQRPCF
jgi:CHAT domain